MPRLTPLFLHPPPVHPLPDSQIFQTPLKSPTIPHDPPPNQSLLTSQTHPVRRFTRPDAGHTRTNSLKPHWQSRPADGVQKLCIGNMNRVVDVYDADGDQLAQLGGNPSTGFDITAVPAVAQFHPTRNWVAAGTASGKVCLWL